MQYKKAKKLGMAQRAQEKEIIIRETFLDRNAHMFVFSEFSHFRDPAEFSSHSLQFWKREEMARNMLKWQKTAIKTSLTEMDASKAKVATRMHKAILGWCGDKTNPSPQSLAAEVVSQGVDDESMRDEIYCLMLKQLIDNPGPQSVSQGWKILGMCARYFAPSTDLSNYVHVFIRNNAPPHIQQTLTTMLYQREYEGAVLQKPQPDEIPRLAAEF
jgi:hypothetical protein